MTTNNSEINYVVIRVDSSQKIGSGHVMRCLSLASALRKKAIETHFICQELSGNQIDQIIDLGFNVERLPPQKPTNVYLSDLKHADWLEGSWEEDAEQSRKIIKQLVKQHQSRNPDWLVVDHYALDIGWESELRSSAANLLVIDDLADRRHDCDLLLDQNLYEEPESRYKKLVDKSCTTLIGPRFTLLREEFTIQHTRKKNQDCTIKKIFVFFGGVDITNETEKSLKAISQLDNEFSVDVLVGSANPNKKSIETLCDEAQDFNFFCQVDNISKFMLSADLAIGCGGVNAWERCYLGLPSIIWSTAHNQHEQVVNLQSNGACISLGESGAVTQDHIKIALNDLLEHPEKIKNMMNACERLMENHKGSSGVIEEMIKISPLDRIWLRELDLSDEKMILEWRNKEHIRDVMFNNEAITPRQHSKWISATLNNENIDYKVIMLGDRPIGTVNVVLRDNSRGYWGFYLGKTDCPRGTGTVFAKIFINYIFETYDLNLIIGEVLSKNEPSIRLHEKLGFRICDGELGTKSASIRDDVLTMCLKRSEWALAKAQTQQSKDV